MYVSYIIVPPRWAMCMHAHKERQKEKELEEKRKEDHNAHTATICSLQVELMRCALAL